MTDVPTRPQERSLLILGLVVLAASAGLSGGRGPAPGAAATPAGVRDPAWSPDGTRIAITLYDRLHLATLDGRTDGPLVRWSGPLRAERDPAWSPDGRYLALAADAGNGFDLYVQIEDRFPRRTLDSVAARGHRFSRIGRKGEVRYGYAAGALVNVAAGVVEAGAEPRRSHAALSWPAADPGGDRQGPAQRP